MDESLRISNEMRQVSFPTVWTIETLRIVVRANQELIGRIDLLQREIQQQPEMSLLEDREVIDLDMYGHHVIREQEPLPFILAIVGSSQVLGQ
jgi:hypothetical protein